ncbi:MAG: sugar/nucleoside kinase (ribokinase family) [Candidatus Omnitrophota bacterium]|jgi:sugar/nucleoside kinase (ribokinase family)
MKNIVKNPLVVVGSVALDSVKTPFGQVKRALGGSAVYFSCAARLFSRPEVVAVVGKDFPNEHLLKLKKLGINLDSLAIEKGKTFHWQGYYNQNLNEAITQKTELNVFADFDPHLSATQIQAKYLFLANIHPALQLNVLKQAKRPKWVALDTMNFWIESAKSDLAKVIKRVDIVLMNDGEIRQYTGEDNLQKAVKKITDQGPSIVVVKRGEYGAICFTPNGHFALPAYLLSDALDPTGAGDSFAGGFLGWLSQVNRPKLDDIKQAALMGTMVASFNVQGFSINQLADVRGAGLEKRLKQFRKMLV